MLVNCPKCGFSQPKDKYCAKCGVDMESFHPLEKPLLQRILLHPALHITMIFLLVFISVVYIKTSRQQSFLERVSQMPTGPRVLVENQESAQQEEKTDVNQEIKVSVETQTRDKVIPSETPENPPTNTVQLANGVVVSVPPAAAPSAAATTNSKTTNSIKLKVYYSEIDNTTITRWVPKMQATGQFSDLDIKMGELPDAEKEMALDRSIVNFDTVEKAVDNQHTNFDWFLGKANENVELGLKTNISINEFERNNLKGEIKLTRYVEPGDPKVAETEFDLMPKSGWVIWGILPRTFTLPSEEALNPHSILQIFKSARFKKSND